METALEWVVKILVGAPALVFCLGCIVGALFGLFHLLQDTRDKWRKGNLLDRAVILYWTALIPSGLALAILKAIP